MAASSMKQTRGWFARVARAARGLPAERRLAAIAAVLLFLTLFLPWYQETVVAKTLRTGGTSITGWGAFSLLQALLVVVCGGVLTLLFRRAEGRPAPVPVGDGVVVVSAGGFACLLVLWAMLNEPAVSGHGVYAASAGIEWGIFVALAMAGLLAYSGKRILLADQHGAPQSAQRREAAPSDERRHRVQTIGTVRRPARNGRRAADTPAGENPLRRLFEERPPLYERPQWSGSEIGAFEPASPREGDETSSQDAGPGDGATRRPTSTGNAPTRAGASADAGPTRATSPDTAPTRAAGSPEESDTAPTRAGAGGAAPQPPLEHFPPPVAADPPPDA